jgi:hypothetical protein
VAWFIFRVIFIEGHSLLLQPWHFGPLTSMIATVIWLVCPPSDLCFMGLAILPAHWAWHLLGLLWGGVLGLPFPPLPFG